MKLEQIYESLKDFAEKEENLINRWPCDSEYNVPTWNDIYDELPDDQLMEDCGWVLDKAHDDLDNFQLGLTRKIINKAAARSVNDMWS